MKLLAVTAALALLSGPAFAQTINSQTGSNSQSGAYSGVNIQHGNQARTASSAIAPGLIAGGLVCVGSISVGGAAAGWGTSFGMTYPDRNCNAREDAKYILLISNNKLAAKERLCDVPRVRSAYAASGDPCIRDRRSVRYASGSRTTVIRQTSSAGYATSSPRGWRDAAVAHKQDNR